MQNDRYRPFGLEIRPLSYLKKDVDKFDYGFQKQELQDEFNLQWSQFKYRNADVQIGRFHSVDPLAHDYTQWSPYVFSGNIIVNAIELEGLEPVVLSGELTAYMVQPGQGPSQIAADLNSKKTQSKYGFSLERKVTYKDIIASNASKFNNVGDINNMSDPGFNKLNLNPGDKIGLSVVNLREFAFKGLTNQINDLEGSISKNESKVKSLEGQIAALRDERNEIERRQEEQDDLDHDPVPGDPGEGVGFGRAFNTLRNERKIRKLNKKISKANKTADSLREKNDQHRGLIDDLNKMLEQQ